jgi:hypothetical protein
MTLANAILNTQLENRTAIVFRKTETVTTVTDVSVPFGLAINVLEKVLGETSIEQHGVAFHVEHRGHALYLTDNVTQAAAAAADGKLQQVVELAQSLGLTIVSPSGKGGYPVLDDFLQAHSLNGEHLQAGLDVKQATYGEALAPAAELLQQLAQRISLVTLSNEPEAHADIGVVYGAIASALWATAERLASLCRATVNPELAVTTSVTSQATEGFLAPEGETAAVATGTEVAGEQVFRFADEPVEPVEPVAVVEPVAEAEAATETAPTIDPNRPRRVMPVAGRLDHPVGSVLADLADRGIEADVYEQGDNVVVIDLLYHDASRAGLNVNLVDADGQDIEVGGVEGLKRLAPDENQNLVFGEVVTAGANSAEYHIYHRWEPAIAPRVIMNPEFYATSPEACIRLYRELQA